MEISFKELAKSLSRVPPYAVTFKIAIIPHLPYSDLYHMVKVVGERDSVQRLKLLRFNEDWQRLDLLTFPAVFITDLISRLQAFNDFICT